MRTFTIYPHSNGIGAEPDFAIRATYPEPTRTQRYGALQVCTGWTRERVLERFQSIGRHDVVTDLAQQLSSGRTVTIEMGPQELILWNRA